MASPSTGTDTHRTRRLEYLPWCSEPIGSVLALFREGMASTQVAYRLLCYFKILDAWKNGQGPFAQSDELLKKKNRRRDKSRLKLDDRLFSGKGDAKKYEDYLGKKFTWVIDQCTDARDFIAHPFRRSGEFISLDDPNTLIALGDLANIAERMAIEVVVEELQLLSSIAETDLTERVVRSLVHPSWGQDVLEECARRTSRPA